MRIYIAGPIMGVTDHAKRFDELSNTVRELGHVPVNPLDVQAECGGSCTESGRIMLDSGHTWECYLRFDISAMLRCDAVVFMQGWERSHGARFEHSVAAATGLLLFYEGLYDALGEMK